MKRYVIGTRGSPLALVQAKTVAGHLQKLVPDCDFVIDIIHTKGDQLPEVPLQQSTTQGLFCRELDFALLDGRIDLAVHSLKDLPTTVMDGILLMPILSRADPRDAFIGADGIGFDNLLDGSVIGTASLRRQAQIKHLNPSLKTCLIRGNVQTRLRKMTAQKMAGTFLAYCGLERLKMPHVATTIFPPDVFLPAVGQGILGATCRAMDSRLTALLQKISSPQLQRISTTERTFMQAIEGNCTMPIGGYAIEKNGHLFLTGGIGDAQKGVFVRHSIEGDRPEDIAQEVADVVRQKLESLL